MQILSIDIIRFPVILISSKIAFEGGKVKLNVFIQDIETFDLEDFKYNFVNITAFRLVDADDVGVRGILRDMEKYQSDGNNLLNKSRVIQVSTALI